MNSNSYISFFVTGGTMRGDAPSYVERQADHQLYQGLLAGEFCYVLTSRQMGKSSLMVRTANRLRAVGVQVVVLDLTAIGQNVSPDQWYHGLLVRVGEQLELEDELEAWWDKNSHLGPCQRFFSALRHVVLEAPCKDPKPRTPHWAVDDGGRQRLVIFVDEIDVVGSVSFPTDEFFAAIRECYNRRTEDSQFCRVTFCLLGVAMPSDLIRDTRLTPFNIGRRIELTDFTAEEAATLGSGLRSEQQSRAHTARLLNRVLFWTGGHPYLTQRLCETLSGREKLKLSSVDAVCAELFLTPRASERDDNLTFVRERLLRGNGDLVGLLGLYQCVLRGKHVPDETTNVHVSTLRLSGIVRGDRGRLIERNLIYEHVFDGDWVNSHMPDAEVRRQRAAYRQGIFRAAGIGISIVAVLAVMVVITMRKSEEAQRASGRASVAEAEATRVSGLQGQRYKALDAVQRAVPFYANWPVLQNLVISASTLVDLKPGPRFPLPTNALSLALAPNMDLYAVALPSGRIAVRSLMRHSDLALLQNAQAKIRRITFSRTGRYLAVTADTEKSGDLAIWDWQKAAPILSLHDSITAVEFGPEDERIAVGFEDGRVRIYAGEAAALVAELDFTLGLKKYHPIECIRFDPSGERLAMSSRASLYVQVWDATTQKLVGAPFVHRLPALDLAWHPQGLYLATAGGDGDVYLWQVEPSKKLNVLHGHEAEVQHLAFSARGDILASVGADKTLRLWLPSTSRQVVSFLQGEKIEGLLFSADDRRLGWSRSGSTIQLWDVASAREYQTLFDPAGLGEEFQDMDFSPDGRLLAVATSAGVRLWDVSCGKSLEFFDMQKSSRHAGSPSSGTTRSARFDPVQGTLLISGSEGVIRRDIRISDAESSLRVGIPEVLPLPDGLGRMTVAANGKTAAVIDPGGIYLFNPEKGSSETPMRLQTDKFYQSLALSPDAKYVAAVTKEGNFLNVWDVQASNRVSIPALVLRHPQYAFSPDGKWFCAASDEGYTLWQVGTWGPGPPLARERSGNQSCLVAFSQDTSLLAIASAPAVIELLRFPAMELVARLESPDRKPLAQLRFSPDMRRLAAAASLEPIVFVWDLSLMGEELARFGLGHGFERFPPAISAKCLSVVLESADPSDPKFTRSGL